MTPFYIFASEASYQQGFFLSPYIELVRDGRPLPDVSDSKVCTLLKFAADRGVRVYVLLHLGLPAFNFLDLFFFAFFYFPWPVSKDSVGSQHAPACSRYHETMNLVPNDSEYAEAELKHPNIFVMRHRSRFNSNLLWTHHEKLALSSSVSG